MEEQRSQERAAKRREEKLKDLYETQRRRVEANLRLKQKQRDALARAELAAAGIHIRIQDSVSAPTCLEHLYVSTFTGQPANYGIMSI